ncbi:nicotinate-nucleotide--dimethylbenzimidazole phosphoribosyltransferase, partial [Yoonia sp.]
MSASFSTLAEFRAVLASAPDADPAATAAAQDRNGQLTKPPGALGRLEDLAIWYAGWRGTDKPSLEKPQVIVFAGNHGVCAQGVSAFPPEVTVQMVANFEHGGAAINQLSQAFGAKMDVHALDLDNPTADFTVAPAMTEEEVIAALRTGWDAVDPDADLLVTGEMGIGNTTSAA